MHSSPRADAVPDRSQIAATRKAWIEAVIDEDTDRLSQLVTDDVVAIHGDGRCVCGKEELKRALLEVFGRVDVERTVPSSEVAVYGQWAIEIDEVESTRVMVGDDTPIETHFRAVFVFQRQPDGCWKVARVMELLG